MFRSEEYMLILEVLFFFSNLREKSILLLLRRRKGPHYPLALEDGISKSMHGKLSSKSLNSLTCKSTISLPLPILIPTLRPLPQITMMSFIAPIPALGPIREPHWIVISTTSGNNKLQWQPARDTKRLGVRIDRCLCNAADIILSIVEHCDGESVIGANPVLVALILRHVECAPAWLVAIARRGAALGAELEVAARVRVLVDGVVVHRPDVGDGAVSNQLWHFDGGPDGIVGS